MSDIYEKDLSAKSNLLPTDFIRVVGADNVTYKQLVSDVAKCILEQYSGSTIAGTEQPVKTAVDGISSDVSDISTIVGDGELETQATDLTGAVNEHNDFIGSDTMGTTATTITGAIAEHQQGLDDLNSNTYNTYTTSSGATYAIRKRGNVVEFWYIDSSNSEHTVNTWNTLLTLPQGYKPVRNIDISIPNNYAGASGAANSFTCPCRIDSSDGTVKIWPFISHFNAYIHAVWLV